MSVDLSADDDGNAADDTAENLAARVELLQARNEQLREAYAAARLARHRRTALGLLGVGLVALAGAVLVPPVRTVLLALAGTGAFAAVLTYLLTPERFVAASVGPAVFDAHAATVGAAVDELGLADVQVYLPADGGRLFLPQHDRYDLPADAESLFVVADREPERGVAIRPTGGSLVDELGRTLDTGLASEPRDLADQLSDGLTESYELADSVEPDLDAVAGRLTVGVVDPAYEPLDRLDHPLQSLLGVGLARGLSRAVTVEVSEPEDGRYDSLVVCSWEPSTDEPD
jgi:hypothetical protein